MVLGPDRPPTKMIGLKSDGLKKPSDERNLEIVGRAVSRILMSKIKS